MKAFFDEYVFGFMKHDLEVAIEGRANFLAALGLVTYAEVLGALCLGTILDPHGNQEKFEAFLPYLGQAYSQVDQELKKDPRYRHGLYQVVRCGLVHEYFPKADAVVARHGPGTYGGVIWEPIRGVLAIVLRTFLEDFLAAATKAKDDIMAKPEPETLRHMCRFVTLKPSAVPGATLSTTPNARNLGTFWD